jgi:hypothetical protein
MNDLDSLLDFENAHRAAIERVAAGEDGWSVSRRGTSFSGSVTRIWLSPAALGDPSALTAYLAAALRGVPLLDLGCGGGWRSMREAAARAGSSAYVGVDKYHVQDHTSKSAAPLPTRLIRADMLEVASRLRSERYAVTLNGIDDAILYRGQTYSAALAHELCRALTPGSVVFGVNALVSQYLDTTCFAARAECPLGRSASTAFVFEKL